MRRIFKTRYFIRWMRKTALNDEVLCVAVNEMEQVSAEALSHRTWMETCNAP